ncbi:hypothetical protein BpHYR1_027359 [Brachionus plicatilis]|uniref:Uncharacterized protein n=1 Tax=Brachionus plicatilis TaxID=10195 RepID=A0A3M7QQ68_BRAPC|nr:hypothetical protein BpHYR1_027359 [Brachionus plicatilis]
MFRRYSSHPATCSTLAQGDWRETYFMEIKLIKDMTSIKGLCNELKKKNEKNIKTIFNDLNNYFGSLTKKISLFF